MTLMSLVVPTRVSGMAVQGPLPDRKFVRTQVVATAMDRFTEAISKGSSNKSLLSKLRTLVQKAEEIPQAIESSLEQFGAEFYRRMKTQSLIIRLEIGQLKDRALWVLDDLIVESSDLVFSQEQDENGYPISATVTWNNIESMKIAYKPAPKSKDNFAPARYSTDGSDENFNIFNTFYNNEARVTKFNTINQFKPDPQDD
jgi:hypothetical protein